MTKTDCCIYKVQRRNPVIIKRSGTSLCVMARIERDLQGTGTTGFDFAVRFLRPFVVIDPKREK